MKENGTEFKKNLGENIRTARIKKGFTQEQLGNFLGKSDNVITNWEKGTNRPDANMIERLCSVLEVSPNWLLNWEEKKQPDTIAAHYDGVELTPEERKEIENYIHYILSKRNK